MRVSRIVATIAATAVALAIPIGQAQATPAVQVEYSTSCGRVTAISSSTEQVSVYYGPSALSTDLAAADGTLVLGQSEVGTIATTKSTLYVTAHPFGSTPTEWTVKALTVPQNCTSSHPKITISGTTRVGRTLKANLGNWAPKPLFLTYTWYRSGKVIAGAQNSTYKLTSADKGKHVKVKANATFVGYKSVSSTSKSTTAVKVGFLKTSTPKINNYEWEATAKPGSWTPTPVKFAYQWYVGTKRIKGATKVNFGIPTSYIGKRIKVRVTGKKSGYTTVVRYSKSILITASA
jgi:hypothetical protein